MRAGLWYSLLWSVLHSSTVRRHLFLHVSEGLGTLFVGEGVESLCTFHWPCSDSPSVFGWCMALITLIGQTCQGTVKRRLKQPEETPLLSSRAMTHRFSFAAFFRLFYFICVTPVSCLNFTFWRNINNASRPRNSRPIDEPLWLNG